MPSRRPSRPLRPAANYRATGRGGAAGGRGGQGGSQGSGRGAARRESELGGEQIEGRHAVRELLAARRRQVFEVFISADADRAPILEDVMSLATRAGVPLRSIPHDEIERLSLSDTPQGVIARADPLQAVDLAELLAASGDTPPFLIALDGVTDPHNLGAVLRSALASGVTGIVLPRHRSARISATVAKAAAGAVEHLPVALVAGIPAALSTLAERSVWSVGLDAEGTTDIEDVRVLSEPLVLVLGAEGAGLASLTRARCDVLARIPLVGPLASLNVSAAAAVACFTVARHRTSD